jgi:hypothetical protein
VQGGRESVSVGAQRSRKSPSGTGSVISRVCSGENHLCPQRGIMKVTEPKGNSFLKAYYVPGISLVLILPYLSGVFMKWILLSPVCTWRS